MKNTEQPNLDIRGKNVLVIGYPAAGKTTFVEGLHGKDEHIIFHTDDYIDDAGVSISLASLMYDLSVSNQPTLVEGVLGYALLYAGVDNGTYIPDVVFEVKRSFSRIEKTYHSERKGKSMSGVLRMIEGCDRLLRNFKREYPYIAKDIEWHTINTEE